MRRPAKRKGPKPFETLLADGCHGGGNRIGEKSLTHRLKPIARQLRGNESGIPVHFVRIPEHAGPTEIADAVDDLRRTRATAHEVTAMDNEVGTDRLQVGNDRFECRQVGVNV